MGNSGSHNSTLAEQHLHQSWAHSFPRDPQRTTLKVLPDLDSNARLRVTNNGTILHSGGTISGRKEGTTGVHRSRSVSSQHHPHVPSYRDPLHRSQNHLNLHGPSGFAAQAKRFGSEPDLRFNATEEYNAGARHRISREKKKKSKAPPPPIQESSPESDRYGRKPQNEPPMEAPRKLRLFKTRAESKTNLKKEYQQLDISKREMDPEDYIPAEEYDNYDQDAIPKRERRRKISYEDRRKSSQEDRRSREDIMRSLQEDHRRSTSDLRRRSQEDFRRSSQDDRRKFGPDDRRIPQEDRRRAPRPDNRRTSQEDHRRRVRDSRSQDRIPNGYMHNDSEEKILRMPEFEIARPEFRRQKSFDHSLYNDRYDSKNDFDVKARYRSSLEDDVISRNKLGRHSDEARSRKSIPNLIGKNLASPEFQKELKMATKLRGSKANEMKDEDIEEKKSEKQAVERINSDLKNKSKLKTMDLSNRNNIKDQYKKTMEYTREEQKNIKNSEVRGQASGKESTPGNSPNRVDPQNNWESSPIIKAIQDRPPKTFYFGMDEQDNCNSRPDDVVEQFAASLMQKNRIHRIPASSESALSSEAEDDLHLLENNTHGIDLQLRPTLPKKQLEIPRFSPAAAWRLLSNMEGHDISPLAVDDVGVLEDRIERLPRINHVGPPHDNKSGDSGISGDAGPVDITDCPRPHNISKNMLGQVRPVLTTWTPQQDLGEESSSDGGLDSQQSTPTKPPIGVSSKAHVFSLSLPRENHLAVYTDKQTKQPYNSLQKLKRSVSGALNGVLASAPRPASDNPSGGSVGNNGSANWYLSRSAPTSLDNGQMSPAHLDKSSDSPSDPDEDCKPLPQRPFSYLSNHVMYLPILQASNIQEQKNKLRPYKSLEPDVDVWHGNKLDKNENILGYNKFHAKPYTVDENEAKYNERNRSSDVELRNKSSHIIKEERRSRTKSRDETSYNASKLNQNFSKSCDNITNDLEDLQDPPPQNQKPDKPRTKGKKFTFQSTVRQIERKRLAEKLSKEAEQKEKQRLGELEAMRRVEEEFQKKRAREKASIRQQLRMYSLGEKESTSLPVSTNPARAEPDGAVSSPAPSPQNPSREHFSKTSSQIYYNENTKRSNGNQNSMKYNDQNERKETKYSKFNGEQNGYKNEKENKLNRYDEYTRHYKDNDFDNNKDNVRKYREKSTYDQQTPYISKLVEQRSSQRRGRERVPTTEILSEFRQPRREYLEYRSRGESPSTQQLIHPQVVGNIPSSRSPQIFHNDIPTTPLSDNYRKEFARGRSVGSSDSERSMPSVTARHQHRSRSASPDMARKESLCLYPEGANSRQKSSKNRKENEIVSRKPSLNCSQDKFDTDDVIVPMFKKRPSLILSGIVDSSQHNSLRP